jgi:hypothetical protein
MDTTLKLSTMSDADNESLMEAVKGNILILLASGAREVSSAHMRDTGFSVNGHSPGQHETLQAEGGSIANYLSQVESLGMKKHEVSIFSAHQMGSCRMSCSPLSGAVDANEPTHAPVRLMSILTASASNRSLSATPICSVGRLSFDFGIATTSGTQQRVLAAAHITRSPAAARDWRAPSKELCVSRSL